MTDKTPATLDPQDPLPEQDWTWRRTFTYALTVVACTGVGFSLHYLHDLGAGEAIYNLSRWMLWIIALLATYYMIAPSAEQITKWLQTARTLRAGIPLRSVATLRTPQGTVEARKELGGPPTTQITPIAPERASPGAVGPMPEEAPWNDPSKR